VDSTKAITFKLSRRRPAASPVHDPSLIIITVTKTDKPSPSSAVIKSNLTRSSTSLLLKGHVTTNSAFANECTVSITGSDGNALGMKEGEADGDELGLAVGLTLGSLVGLLDGRGVGAGVMG
jgi:hypothetical protein